MTSKSPCASAPRSPLGVGSIGARLNVLGELFGEVRLLAGDLRQGPLRVLADEIAPACAAQDSRRGVTAVGPHQPVLAQEPSVHVSRVRVLEPHQLPRDVRLPRGDLDRGDVAAAVPELADEVRGKELPAEVDAEPLELRVEVAQVAAIDEHSVDDLPMNRLDVIDGRRGRAARDRLHRVGQELVEVELERPGVHAIAELDRVAGLLLVHEQHQHIVVTLVPGKRRRVRARLAGAGPARHHARRERDRAEIGGALAKHHGDS